MIKQDVVARNLIKSNGRRAHAATGGGFDSRRPDIIRRAMFHVYVLRSTKTGRRYVGSCEDLDERFRRHNLGHSKATRHGVPWTLVHTETFSSRRSEERSVENDKTGRGREELDQKQR